jgi:regulator of PEP synthase PpsR (kinase-PPPase family)
VAEELMYARRIFDRGGFTEIQITNKPIESSANEILSILTARYNREKWRKEEEGLS